MASKLGEMLVKAQLITDLVDDLKVWQQQTGEFPGPTFGATFGEIRRMKPKEMKELRAKFEAHRAAKVGSGEAFFQLEGV